MIGKCALYCSGKDGESISLVSVLRGTFFVKLKRMGFEKESPDL